MNSSQRELRMPPAWELGYHTSKALASHLTGHLCLSSTVGRRQKTCSTFMQGAQRLPYRVTVRPANLAPENRAKGALTPTPLKGKIRFTPTGLILAQSELARKENRDGTGWAPRGRVTKGWFFLEEAISVEC